MLQSPARAARLFIAVDIPSDWQEALELLQREQERLAPGYFRWVKPELMHVTLVFLGQQSGDLVAELALLLGRAATETTAFKLTLGQPGVFGAPRAPRVLWAGLGQPTDGLQRLRRALEFELRSANVSFDQKPLAPHITLGRARQPGDNLARSRFRLLRETLPPLRCQVERVLLVESQLSPRGSTYVTRADARLAS